MGSAHSASSDIKSNSNIFKKVKNTFDRNYILLTKVHYIQSAYFCWTRNCPLHFQRPQRNLLDHCPQLPARVPRADPWVNALLRGPSLHLHYMLLTAVIKLKQRKAKEICIFHQEAEGIMNARSNVTDEDDVERLWRADWALVIFPPEVDGTLIWELAVLSPPSL